MQLKSFHWLSHHGIWAIIPDSTNMVSKRVIFGAFLFLVQSIFLHFGGVFNKTIIPFCGCWIWDCLYPARPCGPRWLFTISYPTRAPGIIVKGTLSRCSAHANLTGFFHRKTIKLSLCRIMPTRQSDSWALFYIPFATRVHLSITGRKVNSLN